MKYIKIIFPVLLIMIILCSCSSKLSGKYEAVDSTGITLSMEFKDNTVTTNILGFPITGEYTLNGDKLIITYSFYGLSQSFNAEIKNDQIIFGDITLKKATGKSNSANSYYDDINSFGTPKSDDYYGEESLIILDGRNFQDGVAWVKLSDNNWSVINKEGKVLFSLNSGSKPSTDFCKGIAIVNGNTIINKNGVILNNVFDGKYNYEILSNISIGIFGKFEGYVFVRVVVDTFEKTENRIGVIGPDGEWYIEPTNQLADSHAIYPCPSYFGEGMYLIEDGPLNSGVSYFLDINSKKIVEIDRLTSDYLTFENGWLIDPLRYQYVAISNKDGNVYTIYPKLNDGNVISTAGKYRDGLFYGTDLYAKEGHFYDIYGDMAIDLSKYKIKHIAFKHDEPYFSNGYCFLEIVNDQGSEWFTIIDKQGNFMFEPRKIVEHGEISEGLVFLNMSNNLSVYIDMNGNEIISIDCSKAYDFSEGLALIVKDGKIYYIDKSGNIAF